MSPEPSDLPPDLPSLSEAVDNYLKFLSGNRNLSQRTVDGYRDELELFIAFAERKKRAATVTDVSRALLEDYQDELARATVKTPGRNHKLAPSTRKRRLVALRSFLRYGAVQKPWFAGDLGALITLPKLPRRTPKPLESQDRDTLLGRFGDDLPQSRRDRAFIYFMLSTGCRISEALAVDRVQLRADRVVVKGKGNVERVVEVTDRARRAVNEYLEARTDASPALFISLQHAKLSDPNNRLSVRGAEAICARIAKQLGLPPFHPHQLRHTLGTLLQEQVGNARLTADVLGHSGLASVAGYTEITDRARREAYDTLEDVGL